MVGDRMTDEELCRKVVASGQALSGKGEEEPGSRLPGFWGGPALGSTGVQDDARALALSGWRMGGPQQSRVVERGPI